MEEEALSPIYRLPEETLVQTLLLCPYLTIVRFAETCQRYHTLVMKSVSLQLHLLQVELDASGMEILGGKPVSDIDYTSTLKDIRNYRKSWQNFRLERSFQKIHHDIYDASNWHIHDGVLVCAFSKDLAFAADFLAIVPLSAPNSSRQFHFKSGFHFAAVDLGQELAVLVRLSINDSTRDVRVYLVSSVTGRPHPSACVAKLKVTIEWIQPMSGVVRNPFVQVIIMAERLLIYFRDEWSPRYKIVVWNWQSGSLLQLISGVGRLYGVSFLDRDHVAALVGTGTPRVQKLHLLLYAIHSTDTGHSPSQDTPATPTMPSLQLDFPRLRENVYVDSSPSGTNMLIQPEAVPGRPIQVGSTALSYSRVPTIGIKLTLLISLLASSNNEAMPFQRFHVFFSVDCLLRLVHDQTHGASAARSWSEWGVDCSRWLSDEYPQDRRYDSFSHMGISGPRYVKVFDRGKNRDDGERSGYEEVDERDEESTEGDGDADNGGGKGDEGARDAKYSLLSVIDFSSFHWEDDLKKTRVMGEEIRKLIGRGAWPAPGRTMFDPTVLKSSKAKCTIVVGNDIPTVLGSQDGFAEPVESRLPYRFTTRLQVISREPCWPWIVKHDSIIGIRITYGHIRTCIYKLKLPPRNQYGQ